LVPLIENLDLLLVVFLVLGNSRHKFEEEDDDEDESGPRTP
jgi:hypothetical protein